MGIPIITLLGDRHSGRVGASILSNIGLNDFIAQDISTYIQIAIKMAGNIDYLQKIRQSLRIKMQNSSLCNSPSFAKDIELAYREIWKSYIQKGDF